jgi:hypothetical protein
LRSRFPEAVTNRGLRVRIGAHTDTLWHLGRWERCPEISAGCMHSGYPLMAGMDMNDVFVNKQQIISNAHGGVWGLFYEMGHNHQNADWTFDGTVEVTENLFPLYAFEKICHSDPLEAHSSLAKGAWVRNMNRYFANGAQFEQWKQDPFVGLIMYIQLKNAFRWEPFIKTFKEYQQLSNSERPKSDDQKRDQWMVRFSQTIGKNLGPFFQAWGVPTSQTARDSIMTLPQWLPENFPPESEAN